MKKAPFIVLLVLTFLAEALACYFMLTRIKDIKTDPVKVNECMYSITENFGNTSKYNDQLDYVVIDNGGNIMIVGESIQGYYRIRVYDNGRGMPEEAIKHITEAFYRVDKSRSRAQGGAGLGLTLCKEVIQLHGGTIAFASREGNGTCVTVTIKEMTL